MHGLVDLAHPARAQPFEQAIFAQITIDTHGRMNSIPRIRGIS